MQESKIAEVPKPEGSSESRVVRRTLSPDVDGIGLTLRNTRPCRQLPSNAGFGPRCAGPDVPPERGGDHRQ